MPACSLGMSECSAVAPWAGPDQLGAPPAPAILAADPPVLASIQEVDPEEGYLG